MRSLRGKRIGSHHRPVLEQWASGLFCLLPFTDITLRTVSSTNFADGQVCSNVTGCTITIAADSAPTTTRYPDMPWEDLQINPTGSGTFTVVHLAKITTLDL